MKIAIACSFFVLFVIGLATATVEDYDYTKLTDDDLVICDMNNVLGYLGHDSLKPPSLNEYDYSVLTDDDLEICDMDNVLETWNGESEREDRVIHADFSKFTVIYHPDWGVVTSPGLAEKEVIVTVASNIDLCDA